MIFTKSLFNPIKSLKYLEEYFDNIDQFPVDMKRKTELWLITAVAVMKAIQAAHFYITSMSLWWRIFLIDFSVYFYMPVSLNLAFVPITYLVVVYLRMLYYDNNNIVTSVIREVVVKQNNRYFLYETVHNKKISDLVRKYAWIALFAHQPLIITIG